MKTYSILLFALAIILNLTSCNSAKKTFGSAGDNKSYDEKLISFYSQNHENSLTFIGKKHNYTFSNAKRLTEVLKNQNLLALNPLNMSLNIRVKEYKSSVVTLTFFSHFEKSKLNHKQIKWLESHNFSLEQRANLGGKKSESSRPPKVPTFVFFLKLQGEREKSQNHKEAKALTPVISLEVSEHITR